MHIAEKIGRPKAVRAVASAIGQNPVTFLIPCHRIIRSDGTLGGYYWGLDIKKKILKHESTI
jgi:O-6-methylguanine DNA methyltransferase